MNQKKLTDGREKPKKSLFIFLINDFWNILLAYTNTLFLGYDM